VQRVPAVRAVEPRIPSLSAVAPVTPGIESETQPVEPPVLDSSAVPEAKEEVDEGKRLFLRLAGLAGLGVVASSVLPQKAEAFVMGSSPTSAVVGVKNASNTRINPATDETLQSILAGNYVLKKTTVLTSSGVVHTPASGKKIRVYNNKFSLTANMSSVSFRFTSGGTDHEIYLSPRMGGLYGTNNHPNYVEGGVDEVLYCAISGTGSVQINIDYLEV